MSGVQVPPDSTGKIVKADPVSGEHVQFVKLDLGAPGAHSPTSGSIPVTPKQASTSTIYKTNASTGTVPLLAANSARLSAIILNDSDAVLMVKEGATAGADDFSHYVQPHTSIQIIGYTGQLDGIWESATGKARSTERT